MTSHSIHIRKLFFNTITRSTSVSIDEDVIFYQCHGWTDKSSSYSFSLHVVNHYRQCHPNLPTSSPQGLRKVLQPSNWICSPREHAPRTVGTYRNKPFRQCHSSRYISLQPLFHDHRLKKHTSLNMLMLSNEWRTTYNKNMFPCWSMRLNMPPQAFETHFHEGQRLNPSEYHDPARSLKESHCQWSSLAEKLSHPMSHLSISPRNWISTLIHLHLSIFQTLGIASGGLEMRCMEGNVHPLYQTMPRVQGTTADKIRQPSFPRDCQCRLVALQCLTSRLSDWSTAVNELPTGSMSKIPGHVWWSLFADKSVASLTPLTAQTKSKNLRQNVRWSSQDSM